MMIFLLRRFTVAILVALTVLTLSSLLRRPSGDLAISNAGLNVTQADVEMIRQAFGLNRPLTTQYFDGLLRAIQGDCGESSFFHERVSVVIAHR